MAQSEFLEYGVEIMQQKSKKEPESLSAGLQDLFIRKKWSTLWKTYLLTRNWVKIAGPEVAEKTEPAYIQNGILWIYVENSVLMQHMQAGKLQLLEKIQAELPDLTIKDIRWAMRPVQPPGKPGPAPERPRRRATPEAEAAFKNMTGTIENDQCREALQKLWSSFYGKGK